MHFSDGDQNTDQYKGLCQAYFIAFPDLHITTDLPVAEGDKVTKVWTANCTHQGDFLGIPTTGTDLYMYQNSKRFALNRELTVLYVCVFLIMLGFGVSLPALTFHTSG